MLSPRNRGNAWISIDLHELFDDVLGSRLNFNSTFNFAFIRLFNAVRSWSRSRLFFLRFYEWLFEEWRRFRNFNNFDFFVWTRDDNFLHLICLNVIVAGTWDVLFEFRFDCWCRFYWCRVKRLRIPCSSHDRCTCTAIMHIRITSWTNVICSLTFQIFLWCSVHECHSFFSRFESCRIKVLKLLSGNDENKRWLTDDDDSPL